jgi:hypothetical protein
MYVLDIYIQYYIEYKKVIHIYCREVIFASKTDQLRRHLVFLPVAGGGKMKEKSFLISHSPPPHGEKKLKNKK